MGSLPPTRNGRRKAKLKVIACLVTVGFGLAWLWGRTPRPEIEVLHPAYRFELVALEELTTSRRNCIGDPLRAWVNEKLGSLRGPFPWMAALGTNRLGAVLLPLDVFVPPPMKAAQSNRWVTLNLRYVRDSAVTNPTNPQLTAQIIGTNSTLEGATSDFLTIFGNPHRPALAEQWHLPPPRSRYVGAEVRLFDQAGKLVGTTRLK